MNEDETEMAEAYALLRGFQRQCYEDDWPQVKQALRELRCLGVYYLDVHRGNIAL